MEPSNVHRTGKKRLFDDERTKGFKILLPNGDTVGLALPSSKLLMPFEDFIQLVKAEYDQNSREFKLGMNKRSIHWNSGRVRVEDAEDNIVGDQVRFMDFKKFKPQKCHILQLHDGYPRVDNTHEIENLWDLTPNTDLILELPEEHCFETALADLIDNSLQAVWNNDKKDRRLISVDILEDKITIFDSGPGMDGSDENSIVNWAKMGSSLNRTSKRQAIGIKPPYMRPFFSMFGSGGSIASMHLGRSTIVSAKTKTSKKVYVLKLEREALLNCSNSASSWRTSGGIRLPLKGETRRSPHGSFTKIEIFGRKLRCDDLFKLQCKLKDIYFPYIQCDSSSGKTCAPVKFQVNDVDLAEINSGEVAITNWHSCNGSNFVLQIRFSLKQANTSKSPDISGSLVAQEANARLKFVYFPTKEGKESINRIIEQLETEGCGVNETYESFSRVSIRRLCRLLPDARWPWLPLMDLRQKKGDKAQLLKRCCWRVKCFIDTDAGFNPTPSKTDVAHHSPFTVALKNFGSRALKQEQDISIEVYKAEEPLTPLQLEKNYQDWLLQMHELYDEEVDAGEDEPTVILSPVNKKALHVSSDVLRVHQELKRNGATWKSGQKIKVLKGACAGVHKQNLYATLEYFIIEGIQGDFGGDARIICRPLGVPDEHGCIVAMNSENASIDICKSMSLPISIIDSEKCKVMENTEWEWLLQKQRQKGPSKIDLLTSDQCQELELDGALPNAVNAGQVPPKEIVAVLRPANFVSSSGSKNLDQKYIVKNNYEMVMEVNYGTGSGKAQHMHSSRITSTSCKGLHGLYIFPFGCKFPKFFHKAGLCTFRFCLVSDCDSSCKNYEKSVQVKASSKVGKWRLLHDKQNSEFSVRVGSFFPPIALACYDIYENRVPFTCIPEMSISLKLKASKGVIIKACNFNADLSVDKSSLKIKDLLIESNELDKIWPHYKATLVIRAQDEVGTISIPCQVTPGSVGQVKIETSKLSNNLLPDAMIEELILEMFDAYGNRAMTGSEVQLNVDGFCIVDQMGLKRAVDNDGCIDLNGRLKVTAGYGKTVSFSVISDDKVVFEQDFQTEKRELRVASRIREYYTAGSQLENIVFEVVDGNGDVDLTINDDEKGGHLHALTVKTESGSEDSVRYAFREGKCSIPAIPLPRNEGSFNFLVVHSRFIELCLNLKVTVVKGPKMEADEVLSPYLVGKLSHIWDSPSVNQAESQMTTFKNNKTSLESKMSKYAECIGDLEEALVTYNSEKEEIMQVMSELQASVKPILLDDPYCSTTKEEIIRCIESSGQSAASVLCGCTSFFSYREPWRYFMEDVVGVVALIGTVGTKGLSRILAEYLGEDQMLALVCSDFEAARALEEYQQNGEIDYTCAVHAKANALGKFIVGRFSVICLENLRPYTGMFEGRDSQRKLVLEDLSFPGFMGYAVNMVNLDNDYIKYRTSTGYGLRETLLYRLFGELQVYETREDMIAARAHTKHGAVSLDGGILKENGIMSLGRGNPEICFPVVGSEVDDVMTLEHKEKLKQIEGKQLELERMTLLIDSRSEELEKYRKKFQKVRNKLYKYCHLLEHNPNSYSSNSQASPGCLGSTKRNLNFS